MKARAIITSVILILSILGLASSLTEGDTPPYLKGSKSAAPSLIYAEGTGTPDKAEINITITGAGDPLVQMFPQDVVFVIDSSGSMQWNDFFEKRLDAAKYYVDQLKIDLLERAAVVDFDFNATLVGGDHLSTDYPKIKFNIGQIDSLGGTDIPVAMQMANSELIDYGWANHTWIVILLTDGMNCCHTPPYQVPCPYLDAQMDEIDDPLIKEAIDNNIKYYTIGLGNNVSVDLLTNLSKWTGGSYHPAATADELQEIYDEIHQEIVSTAGKAIGVTETLTADFDYVSGSFSVPPTSASGKTAGWIVPSLSINKSWSVTFEVNTTVCGDNMQIDNDTIVTYTSYANETETLTLPPVFVEVIGCYQPPEPDAGGPYGAYENMPVILNASGSYDPDGTIVSYEWDLDNDGLYDDAVGLNPTVTFWNDDYMGTIGLMVTDDDGLTATATATVIIINVDPTASIISASMGCAVGLRVAGSKWSNVELTLFEDGVEVGALEVERWPGNPNKNPSVGSMPTILNITKTYGAVVTYDPYPDDGDDINGDQPNNGKDPHDNAGNPVWLTLDCEGGSNWIHHTFNTQQSKKRDSDHPNHVEPWIVDINEHIVGLTFTIEVYSDDQGSDDLTFTWTYNSLSVAATHLNNPPSPDPYYSPYTGTAPIGFSYSMGLVYSGPGTVTLTTSDDDEGQPTDVPGSNSASITLS